MPPRQSSPMCPSPPRLAALDGLRGVAACVVALYHLQMLHPGGLKGILAGRTDWVFESGWMFVDLFFVISGYIFAHVYLSTKRLNAAELGDFAITRIARLYPLHLILLLTLAVIDWGRPQNTGQAFVAHLLMLQGLVPHAQDGFVSPSWSISIEMVCYFVFALAACSGGKTLTRVAWLLVVLAGAKLALTSLGPYRPDDLVRGIFGFFTGQLMWRYRETLARIPMAALLLALAGGVMLSDGAFYPLLPLGLLTWPAALLMALRLKLFARAPMVWLGDRSYSIYLVHYPVLRVVLRLGTASLARDLIAVAVILFLSDLALKAIERPARTAIRSAWRRRKAAPVPASLPFQPELD